jgi:hypothetical protein
LVLMRKLFVFFGLVFLRFFLLPLSAPFSIYLPQSVLCCILLPLYTPLVNVLLDHVLSLIFCVRPLSLAIVFYLLCIRVTSTMSYITFLFICFSIHMR